MLLSIIQVTKYILLFTILDPTNGFQLQIAIIISWVVAVIFAYFTNRKFVFESKNQNKLKQQHISSQWVKK